jgi:hypothetical protein
MASVEAIADYEHGIVIVPVIDHEDDDEEIVVLELSPDIARQLAMQLSVAAINVEEHRLPGD